MPLHILVDYREANAKDNVVNYMNVHAKYITYSIVPLAVGDFIICNTEMTKIYAVIERKTWEDLSASICDGRKENNKKLIDLREKTGCSIYYLLEGNHYLNRTRKVKRIPMRALQAHVDHMAVRDNFIIDYSKNTEYTAMRLFELARNIETIRPEHMTRFKEISKSDDGIVSPLKPLDRQISINNNTINTNNDTINTNNDTINKNNPKIITGGKIETDKTLLPDCLTKVEANEDKILYELWHSIWGITSLTASCAAQKLKLYKLLRGDYSNKDLEMITYPNGKSIPLATIQKIQKISTNPQHIVNFVRRKSNKTKSKSLATRLLIAVPTISETTAPIILKHFTLKQIAEGNVTKEQLSEIIISQSLDGKKKTKIGKAKAEKILKYLGPEYDALRNKTI